MDRSYQTFDEVTKKLWEPTNSAVVCKQHFTPDDYVAETIQGQRPLFERLKNTAVPSVFSWKKEVPDTTSRAARAERRFSLKRKFDEISKNELEASFATDCQEETVTSEDQESSNAETNTAPVLQSTFTQTDKQPMFSVENFEKDDEAIHYYTGLESYAKFLVILQSLGPAVFSLNYVFFSNSRTISSKPVFHDFNEIAQIYSKF